MASSVVRPCTAAVRAQHGPWCRWVCLFPPRIDARDVLVAPPEMVSEFVDQNMRDKVFAAKHRRDRAIRPESAGGTARSHPAAPAGRTPIFLSAECLRTARQFEGIVNIHRLQADHRGRNPRCAARWRLPPPGKARAGADRLAGQLFDKGKIGRDGGGSILGHSCDIGPRRHGPKPYLALLPGRWPAQGYLRQRRPFRGDCRRELDNSGPV